MSDTENGPEVNTGDVEGDVNVNPPAEEASPEESGGDAQNDSASATDDPSVDTGALQE